MTEVGERAIFVLMMAGMLKIYIDKPDNSTKKIVFVIACIWIFGPLFLS